MAKYIHKQAAIYALVNEANIHKNPIKRAYTRAAAIIEQITAEDVQPVIDTENMATVSDEFICKRCGIYLKDYIKVVMDEDNDGYIDEQHYDYEPKYCPECGARVKQ